MFGFHNLKEAEAIAKAKTEETGIEHVVMPAGVVDGPEGQYTIGRRLKSTTSGELFARLGLVSKERKEND